VLGGLWHGASWTFVMWGLIHGVGQVIGHMKRTSRQWRHVPASRDSPYLVAWQRFVTFQLVCFAWLFFRASTISVAFTMCNRIFTAWSGASPLVRLPVIAAIVGSLALQYVPPTLSAQVRDLFDRVPLVIQGASLAVVLLVITTLGPPGVAPFIYYRF
jgi:alginate O-acetyltransferase complex protein AlgI